MLLAHTKRTRGATEEGSKAGLSTRRGARSARRERRVGEAYSGAPPERASASKIKQLPNRHAHCV
jgi:hypothetical protein